MVSDDEVTTSRTIVSLPVSGCLLECFVQSVLHHAATCSWALQGSQEAITLFFDPITSQGFTSKQWRIKFGDLCEAACGKRMPPNLTRQPCVIR